MDPDVVLPTASSHIAWPSHMESEEKLLKQDRCGIACWRPRCLEPLRHIRAFIAATCFISCLQSAFSGYNSSQITTIEKRFSIGSIIIGVINSSFEVGYISFVMIVSYGGSKGRVPYWIACGLFSMGLGAVLYSTPQFLFTQTPVSLIHINEKLCQMNASDKSLNQSKTSESGSTSGYSFLLILLVAQFLIGAGSSPILTLAPPFIDDHVPAKKAPAMIASIYAAAALGPVFGYALGAVLLQFPVDFLSAVKILSPSITPSSPHWIGAWWTGYIILGSGIIMGAFMLLLFPRHLRSTTPDGISKTLSHEQNILQNLSETTTTIQPLDINNNGTKFQMQHNTVNKVYVDGRSYNDTDIFTRPTASSLGQSSMGSRRHQRSASGGSVFMQAAIAAATASLTAEPWPSNEDVEEEDDNDEDEEEEGRTFHSYHSRERPTGSLRIPSSSQLHPKLSLLDQLQHTVKFRPRHESVPSRHYTQTHKSDFVRSPLRVSLNLRRHSVEQRHQARPPHVSSNKIGSPETSPSSIITPFVEDRAHSSSPARVAMLNVLQESNSEEPITLVQQMASKNTQPELNVIENAFISPESGENFHNNSFKGNSNSSAQDVPDVGAYTEGPPKIAPMKRRTHYHRRNRHNIRGRIFGCIPVWSKDIPHSIFRLLCNKVYIVTCMCICCEMFVVIGFAGFLPKYLETEYQISKTKASMIAGGLVVPSGALGILVGGLILNKAQFGRRAAIILVLSVNIAIIACLASFFFLGCETPTVAGLNAPYPVGPFGAPSLTNEGPLRKRVNDVACTSACNCDPNAFSPVCHRKSRTLFFSPCFAGCAKGPNIVESGKTQVYWNCTCLSSFLSPGEASRSISDYVSTDLVYDDEVVIGHCEYSCSTLTPFICFLTICLFLTGVIQNPLLMVTMRSVSRGERALGLGFQFVIVRFLANLPSPIAFGRAIDGACVRWYYDGERQGDCAIMDLYALTLYITLLAIVIKLFSVIIYGVLIYLIPPNLHGSVNDLTQTSTMQYNDSMLDNVTSHQYQDALPSLNATSQSKHNDPSQASTLKSIQDTLIDEGI